MNKVQGNASRRSEPWHRLLSRVVHLLLVPVLLPPHKQAMRGTEKLLRVSPSHYTHTQCYETPKLLASIPGPRHGTDPLATNKYIKHLTAPSGA